jgi:hypothetical protein
MDESVSDILVVGHRAWPESFVGVRKNEVIIITKFAEGGSLKWQEVRFGFAMLEEFAEFGEESTESGVYPCRDFG